MPIKKLTVSFDLPISTFLSMLAAGNAGMKIDVWGDDGPKQRKLNGHAPKLLEGPRQKRVGIGRGIKTVDADGNGISGRKIALKHIAAHKDRHVTPNELKDVLQAIGLGGNPSSMLNHFKKVGLIKRAGIGKYQITAKGLSEVAKMEASHG